MKNIIIIGAGKGIGLATAKLLASDHQVYGLTKSFSTELDDSPSKQIEFHSLHHDASELAELPEEIHGLVYCPGSINLKPFHRLTEADFIADFNQNVMGAVRVIQQLLPKLKKPNGASVVLFSTVASKIGMPFHASIAVSKSAVEGLTKSLAAELSSFNIRVNCIAPSITDTPLAERILGTDEKREASANRHPLKAVGSPNEMAALVGFLISGQSSWITGQIIGVDGGLGSVKL